MSRQNYYARRQSRQRRQVDSERVGQLVRQERQLQPRLGVRKLRHMLGPELERAGVKLGRDRFFQVCRQQGLLLEPLPARWPRTTQSRHSLPVFPNRIAGHPARAPNQVWVSDVTYLRTGEGFLYLSLITDQYSRKVVGHHAGDTLEAVNCLAALDQALSSLPAWARPIHHSDRGCQYASHEYVGRLQSRGLSVSMTQEAHCAENALAERMNGILKQEYGLGEHFVTKTQARRAVLQAVWLYNTRRPHSALGYRTPQQAHAFPLTSPPRQ